MSQLLVSLRDFILESKNARRNKHCEIPAEVSSGRVCVLQQENWFTEGKGRVYIRMPFVISKETQPWNEFGDGGLGELPNSEDK